MIDFSKITSAELTSLKQIVSRASEKSEWEKNYLFTTDSKEKAQLFCFCHRFLINLNNLLDDGDLRQSIKDTIEETSDPYKTITTILFEINKEISYNSASLCRQLDEAVNVKLVNDIIDLFSILTEKAHTIQISKLKAISLEGKSGEEYTKMKKKIEDKKNMDYKHI